MAQEVIKRIVVISAAHNGYRRAGVALVQGKNTFETDQFNDAQLAMLESDPRLEVLKEDADGSPGAGGQETGLLEQDGVPASLIEAIKRLNPDEKKHFTSAGKPQTDILSELMGRSVSAAERDEAWTEFTTIQANGE